MVNPCKSGYKPKHILTSIKLSFAIGDWHIGVLRCKQQNGRYDRNRG